MRRAAKVDKNQREIIAALKQIGCTVHVLGQPVDLIAGRGARNWLIECKSRTGKKTPGQVEFFANWKGQVRIVRSAQEAVDLINESYRT